MQLSIQRRTELALRALRHLAAQGGLVPGSELAAALGTTKTYLPQIMAPLVSSGWVDSLRGPNGGYGINPAARQLTMLNLIEAFEGSTREARCVLRGGPCPGDETCGMHDAWQFVQSRLNDALGGIPVLSERNQL